jgi:cobalt-zinc-cadmium efflux system outer membrane protein
MIVAALALVTKAGAEPPRDVSLTLAEALQRAGAGAPEVSVMDHVVREREARRVGAGVVMPVNPRISADMRPPLERGFVREPMGYGVMLDALFEVGGAPGARVTEAQRGADVARADLATTRLSAKLRAWEAYLAAQIASLRIDEARAAKVIADRVLEAARRRGDVGASSDIERTQAELDRAQAEVAEKAAARGRDSRLMDLRDALDLPATTTLTLTTPVEDPPLLGGEDGYVRRLVERHPSLAAIRARIALLDATDVRLGREVFPRLGLYAGLDAAPQSDKFGVLGLSVELPVAQRNQGPRAVVGRERETERWNLGLEERRLAREVVLAYENYETLRAELEVLTKSAIPAAERSLLLVETAWQAGRFDLFRVTTAARDLVRVRTARIDTLESAWRERIALERAAGGLS